MSQKITKAERARMDAFKTQLTPGARFATPFEEGCIVAQRPEWDGDSFNAYDSEGVICWYSLQMVTEVTPQPTRAEEAEYLKERFAHEDAQPNYFDVYVPKELGS